jgi:hypothetical protein
MDVRKTDRCLAFTRISRQILMSKLKMRHHNGSTSHRAHPDIVVTITGFDATRMVFAGVVSDQLIFV